MRHRRKKNRFSRPQAQRKALLKGLVRALLIYERITTTPPKAMAALGKLEELVNLAKRGTLHSRRLAFAFLQDHRLVKKLFADLAVRFKDVPSGLGRIINTGFRKGDGARLAIVELTKMKEKVKHKKDKAKEEQLPAAEEHKVSHKEAPAKSKLQKTGLRHGLKNIFKRERDAL